MSLRDRNAALRRQRILNAARAIIVLDGVDALTMRRLADKAQVAVKTLYNLYGNRTAILDGLIEQGVGRLEEALDQVAELQLDPLKRCQAIIGICIDQILRSESLSRALIMAQYQGLAEGLGSDPRLTGRPRQLLVIALREAMEQQRLEDAMDAELLGDQIMQIYQMGLMRWAYRQLGAAQFRVRTMMGLNLIMLGASTSKGRRELKRHIAQAGG